MESDIGKHVQADIHPVKPPLYTKISCRGLGKSLLQQWKNMVHFYIEENHWIAVACEAGRCHRSSAFSYSLCYMLWEGENFWHHYCYYKHHYCHFSLLTGHYDILPHFILLHKCYEWQSLEITGIPRKCQANCKSY